MRVAAVVFAWLAAINVGAAVAAATDRADGSVLSDAWARATPPGAVVAAVYLTIVGGREADRIIRVRTARAAMAQMHAVTHVDGMTRMRESKDLAIPAGARVTLAPDGMHLMLMELVRPLVAGERFVVTLEFARAGPREAVVTVLGLDDAPPARR